MAARGMGHDGRKFRSCIIAKTAIADMRGNRMTNLASVVGQLRKERNRAAKEVQRLDSAIAALGGAKYGKRTGSKISAAGRARIAAAQRARWAKVRAGKKK